jgi:hypothetical protein
MFGMLSPNQPLTPNEFELSRMRVRSMDELDKLANKIDWEPGDEVDPDHRKEIGDEMAREANTQAKSKGGMGLKGTADYTNIAELAKMFKQDPKWFLRKPDETWAEFSERVMSQTRGLSSKVAAFSTVWHDPMKAAISAIDRHMGRKFLPKMFETKKARRDWEKGVVERWNTANPDKRVRNMDQMLTKSGGDRAFMTAVMSKLTAKGAKFRDTKGEINKNIQGKLRDVDWLHEPKTVRMMGDAYRAAIEENARLAEESGMGLFEQQWMEWDRLRRRLEPHEVMYPGLHKLPKMPEEDFKRARTEHSKQGGYLSSTKDETPSPETGELDRLMRPTRPMNIDKSLYWALGGAAVLGAEQQMQR